MNQNPAGAAAVISTTVKLILLALIAVDVVPYSEEQVAAITLAVSGVVDLLLYFGLIKPRTTSLANPTDADGTPLVRLTDLRTRP